MADEKQFQTMSTAFLRPIRRPVGVNTPPHGKCKLNSISGTGSFRPMRVSHGVYMRPIDAPNYKNKNNTTRNYFSVNANVDAQPEIGDELPDPELEKLFDDIDKYAAQEPERARTVRGGTFKKPNHVLETDGVRKVKIEDITQPYQVGTILKRPVTSKPALNDVVVACKNSNKLNPGGNKLAGHELGSSVAADIESRYEKPNTSRRERDSEFKAREERPTGKSLKRPNSEGPVTSNMSSDDSQPQPQNSRKPAVGDVVVACKNSNKLNPGGNKLAGHELDSCVADIESRYEKPNTISARTEKMSRERDSAFKARDDRATGKSLKRPVSDCNRKTLFHGGEKTCRNAVPSESHRVPRMSTQVRKYRRLSDLEFQATKQRSQDVARPVKIATDYSHDMGTEKPMGETKVRSMKHGTSLLKLSNSRKSSLWDKLKHRSCQRTAINCATSRKVEEMRSSFAGEGRIFTCHSSTDGNRAECSRTNLVGKKKKIRPMSMALGLKHDTAYENCQLDRSSSASCENLPVLDMDKVSKKSQDGDDIEDRNRVKDILLRFRALCRELFEDGVRRVDCEAANQLKRSRDISIPAKVIGHIPGIKIGDEFLYRMEISVIGLHKPPQAGIDFLRHETYEICSSIVASGFGGYADDTNNTDYLIYSGHGGICSRGRKDPVDQELQRGNLALKNSASIKNPVRVIRGNKEVGEGGKIRSIFIYDGLYQVESYWQEKATYGKLVYKFKLVRMPGQCKLSKIQWMKLGRH